MKYDYNDIAKLYDDVREADLKTVEFMLQTAGLNEHSKVLEIGCGTGNYLRLVRGLSKAEIWGIDRSEGMLEKAHEKCPEASLVRGDAVKLEEIREDYFDLVYMVDVIHHIKDIGEMFQNIKRVLKEKGILVIFSDSHEHIRNRLTTKFFPETLAAELNRYQDTDELMEKLSQKGFQDIDHGVVEIGVEQNFGPKLIEIAEKRGYSMFGLIPDEAVSAGIERIKAELQHGPVLYHMRAPYVIAYK